MDTKYITDYIAEGLRIRDSVYRLGLSVSLWDAAPYEEGWLPQTIFPHRIIMQFVLTLPFRSRFILAGSKVVEREAVELTGQGLFEFACALALQLPRERAPELIDEIGFIADFRLSNIYPSSLLNDAYGNSQVRYQGPVPMNEESLWEWIIIAHELRGTRRYPGLALANLHVKYVSRPLCAKGNYRFESCFPSLLKSIEDWKDWNEYFNKPLSAHKAQSLYMADDAILALMCYYALGIMIGWQNPTIAKALLEERLDLDRRWATMGVGGLSVMHVQHYRSVDDARRYVMEIYERHPRPR